MKKILLLSMFCYSLAGIAQPIYNSSPEIGQRMTARILDDDYITPIDMESVGTNLNWNVSPADIIVQTPDTAWIVDIQTMPKKELYPNASFAIRYGSDSASFFDVYRKIGNRLELLGESNYYNEPITTYNSPLTQLEFPLMYGDEFGDTCTFSLQIDQDLIRGQVDIFCKAEAWGRLKTTNGTYDCVKLAYRATTQLDINNSPAGSQTLAEYRFYSPGYSAPILVYSATEDEFDGDITNDTTAIYLTMPPIANSENPLAIEINLSPNPVKDILNIRIPVEKTEGAKMAIISPDGSKIINQDINQSVQTLSVQDWPSGVYLVQIIAKDRSWGLKSFTIQR